MTRSICFLGASPAVVKRLEDTLKEHSISGQVALLTDTPRLLQGKVFLCVTLADVFALRQTCECISDPMVLTALCLSDFDTLAQEFPSRETFELLSLHIDSDGELDISGFIKEANSRLGHRILCDTIATQGLLRRAVR
ncbi:hypothetical protein GL50803_003713 [Giardia duodenalis]|uniref:Uncharacterized protein n=1 Tax=Giardia intestinalis (strain ATCC 50803 / WB clone C6) TaxID=184922 RepID=D3KGW6_GIAIC|nr:hypothetical protein GL50803_003713 [Giardia intestinalis]KAE8305210.1 hypothetical protein GL50803_003713 [Giardia intestinalis]